MECNTRINSSAEGQEWIVQKKIRCYAYKSKHWHHKWRSISRLSIFIYIIVIFIKYILTGKTLNIIYEVSRLIALYIWQEQLQI